MKVPPVICSAVSLFVAGGRGQGLAAGADLAEAERVGVAEDGDDQAAVQGHGDADVDLAVLDDRVGARTRRSRRGAGAGPARRPW